MKQGFQQDNPWDSDDMIDDDDEDQEYEKKIQEQLQATKPYEETFDKFQKWYNDFFTKTVNFEDEKLKFQQRKEQLILQLNCMSNVEKVGLFDVTNTKYAVFNKITQIFSYLDMEVLEIEENFNTRLFNILSMYGERPECEEDDEIQDGQVENELARILPALKEIYELIKHMMAIVFNIVNQMNTLYNKKDIFYKNFKNVDLFTPFDTIGTVLSLVYTLDQIIINNECLQSDWNQYKKMIKIIRTEPEKFKCSPKELKYLEKNLLKFEKTVMSKNCTFGFLLQNWELPTQYTANNKNAVPITKNKEFLQLFQNYFKQKIQTLEDILTTPKEINEKQDFLKLMNVYALYRKLFPQDEDKKTFKALWSLQRKSPIIITGSHTLCYTYKYLSQICPLTKSTSLDPKDPVGFIQQYIMFLDSDISYQIKNQYSKFCTWLGRMESVATSNQDFEESQNVNKNELNQIILERGTQRTTLIMSGLLIASQVRNLVMNCLLLHLNEDVEIPPSLLPHIRQGIEIIQAIRYVFTQQLEAFNPTLFSKIIYKKNEQFLKEKIDLARRADSNNKKPEYNEIIGSLEMMLRFIKYPCNSLQLIILNFVSQIPMQKNCITIKEQPEIKYTLQKFKIINRLQAYIEDSTSCKFLYQGRDIIPILMQQTFENPLISKRLPFLISGIEDVKSLLKATLHLPKEDQMFEGFKKSVIDTFYEEFLLKTCRAAEDFLRLNIHTMLIEKIQNKNPYTEQVQQINRLLNVGKVQIFGHVIDIRSEIEQKLNEAFYNINVLNMHDMETYENMRTLADHQFQLKLMHVYIPSQTIDQGQTKGALDILSIIRNIPGFVKKFTYNIYSQNFIEITGESKIVTTVGINQISDSIKTHGLGILNTTVNSTYQFILQKINSFSEFLYDEYISAPLRKEQKWFKQNNEQLDGKYPFARAEHFLKQIKKLGKFEDGTTFIDRFRSLLTEIGNALGFIRLIRSASLNYCSSSIEYLPSQFESDVKFSEMAKEAAFGDTTVEAAQELDDVFDQLQASFSERSDYLKVLVNVIKKKINIPENKHMKLFYQLLPALTLNYVDNVLMAKERLGKSNPFNAFFCDDGLVMGISYFLKLLDQNEYFGSLHWKEEITQYFTQHKQDLNELSQQSQNKKLSTTKQRKAEEIDMQRGLSLRKIEMQIQEFQMFFFSFNACQVLFSEETI